MRICDFCKKQTDALEAIKPEYGGGDACEKCLKAMNKILEVVRRQCIGYMDDECKRRLAAWKKEQGL